MRPDLLLNTHHQVEAAGVYTASNDRSLQLPCGECILDTTVPLRIQSDTTVRGYPPVASSWTSAVKERSSLLLVTERFAGEIHQGIRS